MYVDFSLPRLRLLRYCLRLTLPSWLGVTCPTSRATAVLSPTASMPTHTDCTFNTSTDTWRRGTHKNSQETYSQHHQLQGFLYFVLSKFWYLTKSLVGSSMLWEVALTVSGDTPPSCSWPITASVALCSLTGSLKPEMDTSSVHKNKQILLIITLSHLYIVKLCQYTLIVKKLPL